jgi:hypothetical protein
VLGSTARAVTPYKGISGSPSGGEGKSPPNGRKRAADTGAGNVGSVVGISVDGFVGCIDGGTVGGSVDEGMGEDVRTGISVPDGAEVGDVYGVYVGRTVVVGSVTVG